MKLETLDIGSTECRFAVDEAGSFTGYAAIFGEVNSFDEVLKPGAFRKSLKGRSGPGGVAMLWSHNPDEPVGVWTSLDEDARGLKATGKLITETRRGAEALALMKAKAITGLSIGFRARQSVLGTKAGEPRRTLTEVDLMEISIVSFPAAPGARIDSVRAAQTAGSAAILLAARRAAHAIRGLK